jgi:hypothetical protein
MCLTCWGLYKTPQRDYREERKQVQEIMRRHEAREPIVPTSSSNSNK